MLLTLLLLTRISKALHGNVTRSLGGGIAFTQHQTAVHGFLWNSQSSSPDKSTIVIRLLGQPSNLVNVTALAGMCIEVKTEAKT